MNTNPTKKTAPRFLTEPFTVRFPPPLLRRCVDAATKDGRRLSEFIRRLLEQHVG
jgi:predicted HicB family RNase H-like nuclease